MLRMGHGQSKNDLNLGLGWIYYGFARAFRPKKAVVIGSFRGFTPSVIARALSENEEKGSVVFIDPSLVDNFWKNPDSVQEHFINLETPNVTHYRHTTQEFVETDAYRQLDEIGFLMVDGLHTAEQARFDYLSFLPKLTDDAVVFFHDSVTTKKSRIYGKDNSYHYSVSDFMKRLENTNGVDVVNLPMIGHGLSIVRGKPSDMALIQAPF